MSIVSLACIGRGFRSCFSAAARPAGAEITAKVRADTIRKARVRASWPRDARRGAGPRNQSRIIAVTRCHTKSQNLQTRNDAIEAWAKNWKEKVVRPAARETHYAILHARDVAEFEALGRYSLLILNAMAQRAEELPLKRVYLRMPDRELPPVKIASWRTEVDPIMISYKMFGPYREDGLYLFPLSAYMRVAQLQADFAVNRMSLPVLELPYAGGPDWLRTLQNPDPVPGTLPDLSVLQEFIKRTTSGFPIPNSLPGTTEARRPSPEAQPGEPKRPASLTDLFKK